MTRPATLLDTVTRLHPQWECWRGVSGTHYGRLPKSSPPIVVSAESAGGLIIEIRKAEAALADGRRP
jgi:hypothetical protein